MKAKKIICIIVCFVLTFTLLSGPLRADAEAAGTAIAVGVGCAAIVGLFILAAGYDFETQSDFKAATEVFMNSDGVQFVSKINEFLLGTGNAFLELRRGNLAPIITADWFPAFWNSIIEFFSSGEVSGAVTSAPAGYAYFNGTLLPDLPTTSEYDWLYTKSGNYGRYYYCPVILEDTSYYYLYFMRWDQHQIQSGASKSSNVSWYSDNTGYANDPYSLQTKDHIIFRDTLWSTARFYITKVNASKGDWLLWNKFSSSASDTLTIRISSTGSPYKGTTSSGGSCNYFNFVWSSFPLKCSSDFLDFKAGDIFFPKSSDPSLTLEGDVVGVFNDTPHAPSDVLPTLQAGTIDGSLEWDLSSSSVYQDLTQAGNVPLTSTQTGVLTDIDAVPQTAVKDEAIEEYRANGLANVFPFCIPFDIYRFFSILVAEREAPHFDFTLNFGALGVHDISVDLAEWEQVATILRTIELLAFCVGLAFATSKVIKW